MMRLHLGDCLEVLPRYAPRKPEFPDAGLKPFVDMVFADLPYGVSANKWDSPVALPQLWRLLHTIAKPTANFIFTATQPFTTSLINSQPSTFRYEMVWSKAPTRFQHVARLPMLAHENILVFGRSRGATYNPQGEKLAAPVTRVLKAGREGPNYRPSLASQRGEDIVKTYTHKSPTTILHFSQCKIRDRFHPTQKPVALLEWLIETYSNPGDVILDPTMGSGTTGVACVNTGRQFIGIEKDGGYFKVAADRLQASLGAVA